MIITADQYREEIQHIRKVGLDIRGLETGFYPLDHELKFKMALGRFSVLSGIPGMGKSEVIDALVVNMAKLYGWKTLYFSPENNPEDEHITALVEKLAGKSIRECSTEECNEAIDFIVEHISWMRPKDKTINNLLAVAKQRKKEFGLHWLIIDPWNYVTKNRGDAMMSEHLSDSLNLVTTFTREENVHVTIVAHPTNLKKEKDGSTEIPTLYTISDGAQWRNKCDLGIIVHRPDMMKDQIDIYLGKRKKKWMGQIGKVTMDYDKRSGRFKGLNETEFNLPTDIKVPF